MTATPTPADSIASIASIDETGETDETDETGEPKTSPHGEVTTA